MREHFRMFLSLVALLGAFSACSGSESDGGDGGKTSDGNTASGGSATSTTTSNTVGTNGTSSGGNGSSSSTSSSSGSGGDGGSSSNLSNTSTATTASSNTTGSGGTMVSSGGVLVQITPTNANTVIEGTVQFEATVTGTNDTSVSWSIEEDTDGAISDSGLFTAPTTPGLYHVLAVSVADSEARASARVNVSAIATGEAGVWEDVTPPGISLDAGYRGEENFGAQEIAVDPANPNVVYLSACYQGVWKSTDYGLTFTKISQDGGPMDLGRPWAMGLHSNPDRDPSTPPAIYMAQGYGPEQGFFKSLDDGKTWTRTDIVGETDLGQLAVDPNNGDHIVASIRTSSRVFESWDGGDTWSQEADTGGYSYPNFFFVTPDIWILISEWYDGTSGMRRTTDAGKTWSKVSNCERFHGSSQPFIGDDGLIVAPCVDGVMRSTDYGETWETVGGTSGSAIVGTGTYLYVATGWASLEGFDADIRRSERDGTNFVQYTEQPAGMTNGPFRATVTFDGSNYIVLSSNWRGGVWRYVEP